jgi:hypothetical protein
MKRSIIYFTAIIVSALIYFSGQQLQAQPPNPPSGHGQNGNQGGGGYAPLDGGVLFLLLGGLGYGVAKVIRSKRDNSA